MKVFQIWQNFKSGPILARAGFVKKGLISAEAGAKLQYSTTIFLLPLLLFNSIVCFLYSWEHCSL